MSKAYWKMDLIGESFILGANDDLTDKEAMQYCLGFGKVVRISSLEAITLVERGMGYRELTPMRSRC